MPIQIEPRSTHRTRCATIISIANQTRMRISNGVIGFEDLIQSRYPSADSTPSSVRPVAARQLSRVISSSRASGMAKTTCSSGCDAAVRPRRCEGRPSTPKSTSNRWNTLDCRSVGRSSNSTDVLRPVQRRSRNQCRGRCSRAHELVFTSVYRDPATRQCTKTCWSSPPTPITRA